MKKLVVISIILGVAGMLFLFHSPLPPQQAIQRFIQIPVMSMEMQGTVEDDTTLYAKPEGISEEMARISKGSIVEIVGVSVDLKWYLVEYLNRQGQIIQAWISGDLLMLPGIDKEMSVPDNSNNLEPDDITSTATPEKTNMTETSTGANPDWESKGTGTPVIPTELELTVTPGDPEEPGEEKGGETTSNGQLSGYRVGNDGDFTDDSGLILVSLQSSGDDFGVLEPVDWIGNVSIHHNWNAQSLGQSGPPSPFIPPVFFLLSQTSTSVYQPSTFTKQPFLPSKLPPIYTSTPTFTKASYPTKTPTKSTTPTKTLSIFTPATAPKYISPTPKPKFTSTKPPIAPTNPPIFQPTSTKKPFISPTPTHK